MQCSANTGSFEHCREFGQSVLIVMTEKALRKFGLPITGGGSIES